MTEISERLRILLRQLDISNIVLAKALSVDPSLVSRWLKNGFGKRKNSQYAAEIGKYVSERRFQPDQNSWLRAQLGLGPDDKITPEAVAAWLNPEFSDPEREPYPSLMVIRSFRESVVEPSASQSSDAVFSVFGTGEQIPRQIRNELSCAAEGSTVDIYLSSESVSCAVDTLIVEVFEESVSRRGMTFRLLVQSSNNSAMSSRLISAYMPLLVEGKLVLSAVQGTPQTFTGSMNILIPGCSAVMITEVLQKKTAAVASVVRDAGILRDLEDNFENSLRFARPLMTAYDDSFARNIVEIFLEEYGMPGCLDVIKSGMNPMFYSPENYRHTLESLGNRDTELRWRDEEFIKLKKNFDENLKQSRFREILSLPMLRKIAAEGRCRMPAMYFFSAGICYLSPEDTVNLFDGYIDCLENVPGFQVVLLEDDSQFMPNSCWHIKNNKHIMIHSWNSERPMMVYSDQLMLIDEFQKHFNALWEKSDTGETKRHTIEILRSIRDSVKK